MRTTINEKFKITMIEEGNSLFGDYRVEFHDSYGFPFDYFIWNDRAGRLLYWEDLESMINRISEISTKEELLEMLYNRGCCEDYVEITRKEYFANLNNGNIYESYHCFGDVYVKFTFR